MHDQTYLMRCKLWSPAMDMVVYFILTIEERGQIDSFVLSHMSGIVCIPCDKYFFTTLIQCWCDDINILHLSMGATYIH